jgi:hypothetical protein
MRSGSDPPRMTDAPKPLSWENVDRWQMSHSELIGFFYSCAVSISHVIGNKKRAARLAHVLVNSISYVKRSGLKWVVPTNMSEPLVV